MLRISRVVPSLLFSALAVSAAVAAHTHAATPSTWSLNLSESNFGGGPTMKSDVFVVTTDTEKWLKFSDKMVDGDGKAWSMSWSGPADGTLHPIVGMTGGKFSTNAADDKSVMMLPDGTTINCEFSLSPDKKKYLEKCVTKGNDGKQVNQTLVYDRIK